MDLQISDCPACRTIDRADGVEDGRLYRTVVPRIGDERRLLRGVRNAQDKAADGITGFAGSMPFVYVHAAWFAVWILLNVGVFGLALEFDRFPFGLLTLVVSLEAIFLSTFILISQNRQTTRSEARSQIDFENNLRAEMWAVHIGQALGIDPEHVEHVIHHTIAGYVAEGHLRQEHLSEVGEVPAGSGPPVS
jgi:uncharacterized membrane protein